MNFLKKHAVLIFLLFILSVIISLVAYGFYSDYAFRRETEIRGDQLPQEYIFHLSIPEESHNLLLNFITKEMYASGCGFSIKLKEEIYENFATLEIKAIGTEPPRLWCLDRAGLSPAGAKIYLGSIRPLELSFILGEMTDVYQIDIKDGEIAVEPQNGSFTKYESDREQFFKF